MELIAFCDGGPREIIWAGLAKLYTTFVARNLWLYALRLRANRDPLHDSRTRVRRLALAYVLCPHAPERVHEAPRGRVQDVPLIFGAAPL